MCGNIAISIGRKNYVKTLQWLVFNYYGDIISVVHYLNKFIYIIKNIFLSYLYKSNLDHNLSYLDKKKVIYNKLSR